MYQKCKEAGHRVGFVELVDFISYQCELANSDFGELQSTSRANAEIRQPASRKKVSMFAASSEAQPVQSPSKSNEKGPLSVCSKCKVTHALQACEEFRKSSGYKHGEFLRKSGLCFKCFENGLVVKNCKAKVKCTAEGSESESNHPKRLGKNS